VPVLLNGDLVDLPTVHARVERPYPDEYWISLDEEFPLILKAHVAIGMVAAQPGMDAEAHHQVVRIDIPRTDRAAELAEQLRADGHVALDGIVFDFGSHALRPESEAAIAAAGEALSRNPDWRIRVEGHTDAIGSDTDNLELSRRRADAVRARLTEGYGVSGDRLTTDGYGETRPVDSNDTLAGRARNRRVELVRQS
jgi:outer membrane protein OmpA-like peptidoglycan-associated protein